LRERGDQNAARVEVEQAERTAGEIANTFRNEENRTAYRESMFEKIGAAA
jgi:hypothetical protein